MNIVRGRIEIADPAKSIPRPIKRRTNFVPAGGMLCILPVDELPHGWVSVVEYNRSMECVGEYSGPVVRETTGVLLVEIGGKTLAFIKTHCTIGRGIL
jgi:hypothetical protein